MQKKWRRRFRYIVYIIFMLVCGMLLGAVSSWMNDAAGIGEPLLDRMPYEFAVSLPGMALYMLLSVVSVFAAFFVQILIHEAGHLVFGLLTGYRFLSFRIGSFIWIKKNGKISLQRYHLAGTGGQCLLLPPDLKNGQYPYILYNMGGVLFNLITAFLFGAAALSGSVPELFGEFCIHLMVMGILTGAVNGIPMGELIKNDGSNLLTMRHSAEAQRSVWIQLAASGKLAEGVRLKDMPAEWFELSDEEAVKNHLSVVPAVFACNRLMDEKRFEEADVKMEALLAADTGMVQIYRILLRTDQIYCELVGGNRKERLDKLLDKEQKKGMKTMKNSISVLRTRYAYTLLVEQDTEQAIKIRNAFEKAAEKYPYPCEVASERELMEYAFRRKQNEI